MDFTTISKQVLDYAKHINLNSQQTQKIGIITAATVVSAYALYKQFSTGTIDDDSLTVPYTDSLKGSSLEYRQDPRGFVEKWTERLGPVYHVHLFGRMHTVVSGQYAREVFMNEDFNFLVGTSKKFDVLSMAGIFNGEISNEVIRKTISKHLNPQLKHYTPRVVENLVYGFDEMMGDITQKKELDYIFPLIQRMVARGSATIFVGEKLCKNNDVISVMQNITTDIGKMHPRYKQTWLTGYPWMMSLYFQYIGRFSSEIKRQRQTMLKALIPEIEERVTNAKNDPHWERPDDVLQELVEDSGLPLGQHLYTSILNQILLLVFASIHTTSENGTIVIYRLLQYPEVTEELLKEQQQVLRESGLDPNGKSVDVFTCDVLKKMPKLDSVVREAMRLRNQFYELAHTNIRNHNVVLSNGTVIPPDRDVLINMWYNHHHQVDGGENPGEFKPFRFVDTRYPATKVSDNYLVFGEGKHACPGRWLAIQEIKTIVAMMIREYKMTAPKGVEYPMTGSGLPFGKVTIEKRAL